jgi:hypothetical protein
MPQSQHGSEYNDEYATCVETYSTLRIYSDNVSPEQVSAVLGVEPTSSFRKGEAFGTHGLVRKMNGWFYTTERRLASKDTRRHIDAILKTLEGKARAVELLAAKGCAFDLCSYWLSVGQGGPALWPHQMRSLGELGIEVWWDIYFSQESEA